jgi:hypothetical protein
MKLLMKKLMGLRPKEPKGPPEIVRAWKLIRAIDAGGVPLDPRIITQIAEGLGLEVSRKARPEETIERIRAALARIKLA